jgi:hypothetical protein
MNYFRFFVSASAKAVLVRMAISFYRSQHRVTPRYFVKLALSTSVPTCPNKEVWSVVKTIWIYLGVPGGSLYWLSKPYLRAWVSKAWRKCWHCGIITSTRRISSVLCTFDTENWSSNWSNILRGSVVACLSACLLACLFVCLFHWLFVCLFVCVCVFKDGYWERPKSEIPDMYIQWRDTHTHNTLENMSQCCRYHIECHKVIKCHGKHKAYIHIQLDRELT